jgi:hypothetical protein
MEGIPTVNDHTNPPGHDEIVSGRHPLDPPRSRRGAAVGLLAVGGLAAAGAALYVSNSAGAAPGSSSGAAAASSSTGSSSPTTSSSKSSSSTCPQPVPGAGPRGGPGAGHGMPGGPGRPGGPGADGLITSVSSTGLTVRDLFGTSHAYKVTSSTTIHSGPTGSVKLSTLTRGEHVIVRTTTTSTTTAADIDVHLASIDGAVTSINASAITVTDRDGFTRTIDTDAQTKYTVAAGSSTRSAIKSGSVVHAEGTVDSNGTALDAARVDVRTAASARPSGAAACAPSGPGHAGRGPKPGRPAGPAPTGSGARPTPSASAPSTPAPSTTAPSTTASR